MSFPIKNNKNSLKFKCPSDLKHLAIIMDGNGRWAKAKGWPRYFGHFRGVKIGMDIIKYCVDIKIPYLTLFTFSTENWKRSNTEINILVKLFKKTIIKNKDKLNHNQVRVHILGNLEKFDKVFQNVCHEITESTKNNTGLQLIIALNYGGKREIINAVKIISQKIKEGQIDIKDINENSFSDYLCSSAFPNPDLIIRTGNVSRLSNFYLWSAAYSEIYISSVLWPEFKQEEFIQALEFYNKTQRRFGSVPD